jgi:hypothetical protein
VKRHSFGYRIISVGQWPAYSLISLHVIFIYREPKKLFTDITLRQWKNLIKLSEIGNYESELCNN